MMNPTSTPFQRKGKRRAWLSGAKALDEDAGVLFSDQTIFVPYS
jgi:hypothetical protein